MALASAQFPRRHAFVFVRAIARHSHYTVDLYLPLGNGELDAPIAAWRQNFTFDSIRPVSAFGTEVGPYVRVDAQQFVDGAVPG